MIQRHVITRHQETIMASQHETETGLPVTCFHANRNVSLEPHTSALTYPSV
jgi:hypothetical protein